MGKERYTLGYDEAALAFVGRRRLDFHGALLIEHLKEGMNVLDVGCGPGGITLGIAQRVSGGQVTGVDLSESQVTLATENARRQGISNSRFETGSAYALPVPDAIFDAVFSHALLEHLSDPGQAMREFSRVLRPGGVAIMVTPDWSGFLIGPFSPEINGAIEAYKAIQTANGGDVNVGHKLSQYAVDAGFERVSQHAYFENYDPVSIITDLLSANLEKDGQLLHANALRAWACTPHAMFAEAWVGCSAFKGT